MNYLSKRMISSKSRRKKSERSLAEEVTALQLPDGTSSTGASYMAYPWKITPSLTSEIFFRELGVEIRIGGGYECRKKYSDTKIGGEKLSDRNKGKVDEPENERYSQVPIAPNSNISVFLALISMQTIVVCLH